MRTMAFGDMGVFAPRVSLVSAISMEGGAAGKLGSQVHDVAAKSGLCKHQKTAVFQPFLKGNADFYLIHFVSQQSGTGQEDAGEGKFMGSLKPSSFPVYAPDRGYASNARPVSNQC